MTILPWILLGLVLGLCIGLEIARRAFKDVAARLARSNEVLSEVLNHLNEDQPA